MSTRTRHLRWAVLLLAPLLLVAGRFAAAKTFKVRTDHYDVTTDVSKEFTELLGEHMEGIHREYVRRLRGVGKKMDVRFRVVVHKTRESYDESMPEKLVGSSGAFVSKQKLLTAYLGDRTWEDVFRTLYHEGFHQFAYGSITPKIPVWVNEGLAEYFYEATWDGKGFRTGQVPPRRLAVLRRALGAETYFPLEELLTMTNDQWLLNMRTDREKTAIEYCQSWALVHFLIHAENGRHLDRLLGYLNRMARGIGLREAFKKSFGTDLEGFEKAWKMYVSDLKPDRKYLCKSKMQSIMLMGASVFERPDRFKELSELRRKLMNPGKARWSFTTTYGEKIESGDREKIARLFRCPFDKGRRPTSYRLLRDRRSGMPMLFCTHHKGIVMKAYFYSDANRAGVFQVRVEEQVTATLPDSLRRELRLKKP